jgi:hypothetical protein
VGKALKHSGEDRFMGCHNLKETTPKINALVSARNSLGPHADLVDDYFLYCSPKCSYLLYKNSLELANQDINS